MSARACAAVPAWAVAALVLAACAPPDDDLPAWAAAQRQQLVTEVAQAAPIEAPAGHRPLAYAQQALADPFSNTRLAPALGREHPAGAGAALMASESGRRREPLEAYPLEAMRLVGTLERGGQRIALVQVDGSLHQVRTGQHLGQNRGRVTGISERALSLREIVPDAASEWVARPAVLQLQERAP